MARSNRQSTLDTFSSIGTSAEERLEWTAVGASNGREIKIDGEPGDFICPKCGSGGFSTKRGVRVHYAKMNDDTIGGIWFDCDFCGKAKNADKDQYDPDGPNLCSSECQGKNRRVSREDLIQDLTDCLERNGNVSTRVVADDPECYSQYPYDREFGSVSAGIVAAGLADYSPCPDCGVVYDRLGVHWGTSDCEPPDFTSRQVEIIEGALMGDACVLENSKTYIFRLVGTRKEFIGWVAGELGIWHCDTGVHRTAEDMLERSKTDRHFSFSDSPQFHDAYYVTSRSHSKLKRWRNWYHSGQKRFPSDLSLTPLKLAIWYACDGGLFFPNKRKTRPTHEITAANENDRLDYLKSLFESIGLDPHVSGNKVRFWGNEGDKFREYIPTDPIPGHEYKWASTKDEYTRLKPP